MSNLRLQFERCFFGFATAYVAARHFLPSKEITFGSTNHLRLLSAQSHNLIFCDKIVCWYDSDGGCFPSNTYYWRRMNVNINYL